MGHARARRGVLNRWQTKMVCGWLLCATRFRALFRPSRRARRASALRSAESYFPQSTQVFSAKYADGLRTSRRRSGQRRRPTGGRRAHACRAAGNGREGAGCMRPRAQKPGMPAGRLGRKLLKKAADVLINPIFYTFCSILLEKGAIFAVVYKSRKK